MRLRLLSSFLLCAIGSSAFAGNLMLDGVPAADYQNHFAPFSDYAVAIKTRLPDGSFWVVSGVEYNGVIVTSAHAFHAPTFNTTPLQIMKGPDFNNPVESRGIGRLIVSPTSALRINVLVDR